MNMDTTAGNPWVYEDGMFPDLGWFGHNITSDIRQLALLRRAHSTIHPNRDQCGGLGGCLMLRAEHDAQEQITDTILAELDAGRGVRVTLYTPKES